MQIKTTFILSLVLSLFNQTVWAYDPDNETSSVKILKAWKNPKTKKMIVEFESKGSNSDFYGKNHLYYGDENGLDQMGSTGGPDSLNQFPYHRQFFDERIPNKSSGELNIPPTKEECEVTCESNKSTYAPLSKSEIKSLIKKIASKKTILSTIPIEAREVKHLYKWSSGIGNDLYIYVEGDKFSNSTKNLTFWVGKPGEMKELETTGINKNIKNQTITYISKNGDKLTLPNSNPKYPNRPAVWNGTNALEILDPKLINNELINLQIDGVPRKLPEIRTPCDEFYSSSVPTAPQSKSQGDKSTK